MESNVVKLPPRPRPRPAESVPLAFFVRVGRNDHRELLELIASGEQGICGLVIEAQNASRHRELIAEATRRNIHLVFDPKTQPMGTIGGHSESLAALPWGLERHHRLTDFEGAAGKSRVAQIVELAAENGFTQLLGPTHLLSGPNDPWLRRDIELMVWTADSIQASGAEIDLIYALAVSFDVLRNRPEREALIAAIQDAPCQAIWLKIENFGDAASGEKTAAYIDACRDFHARGLPIVGDRWTPWVGGARLRRRRWHRPWRDDASEFQCRELASTASNRKRFRPGPAGVSAIARRPVEAAGGGNLAHKFATRTSALRVPRHALLPAWRSRHDCPAGSPCAVPARPRGRNVE